MRLLAFLPLLVTFGSLFGQEYSYVNYDSKDGMAGSVVYCAAEDKDGFLWFGTETGLSRFDGTHFRNFSRADGLPDDEIIHLFADGRGRVWIMPFRHSVCYYWKGMIHNPENDSLLRRLSFGSEVRSIDEDRDGNILILEDYLLQIISPDGKIEKISRIDGSPIRMPLGGGLSRDRLTYNFAVLDQQKRDKLRMEIAWYKLYQWNKGKISLCRELPFACDANQNTMLWSPAMDLICCDTQLHILPSGRKGFYIPLPENLMGLSKVDDSLLTLNTTDGAILYNTIAKKKRLIFSKA